MFKKITKRILKVILWVIASFIALDLLVVTLIITPPIQQFIILKASKILTNLTGGEVTVDKIYLSPTLKLTAKNFAIKDHHYENMIFAATLKGKINLAKTAKGQVCLSFAELDNGEVVLRKYAGEESVNIALWANGFKKEEKKESKFKLLFENIKLNDVRFVYINDDQRLYKEDNTLDYAFFELQHIQLDVDNFLVLGPDISCKINSLTLSQHTGFEITELSGNFRIYAQGLLLDSLHFTTPSSVFNGDFAFRYSDFKDFSDFVNLIHFDTKVTRASLAMKDLVYFAPALAGMDNQLVFSGYVGGVVNHIQTKNIYLKYKYLTHFIGDFAIANVLDFKNSSFNIFFQDANINFDELQQFKLPKGKTVPLPKVMEELTHAKITGNFRGSLTKFNTDLLVQTNWGTVSANINTAPQEGALHYSGTVACSNVELGRLTRQPKYLNKVNLQSAIEGSATHYENMSDLLSSISLKLQGNVSHIDLCGYPLENVHFKGNYTQQKVELALNSSDSLASFKLRGSANFSKTLPAPAFNAALTHVKFKPHQFFSHYPHPLDSSKVKGFEKLLLKAQETPNLVFTLDSIAIDVSGNKLDNINGFVGIDYARLTNGERTSRIDWLRFNAINKPNLPHQYILHSNAVNISFKTNYIYEDCILALKRAAAFYIPEMFEKGEAVAANSATTDAEQAIDLELHFYYSQNLFNLLLPKLNIASNTIVHIYLGTTRDKDFLNFSSPRINYTGLGRLNNIELNGGMGEDNLMGVQLQCDSVNIQQKKGGMITFSDIDVFTRSNKKEVQFATSWRNPKGISINEKNHFNGILFGDTALNPSLKITDSKLFIRESEWQFSGNKNMITYLHKNFLIDQCVLSSTVGTISVNGEFSKQWDKQCNILLENFDLSLLNNFTERMRMTFNGNMSLMGIITGKDDHYGIEGKTFVKNFVFNEQSLGDLFLDALVLEDGDPHFIGGIISGSKDFNIDLAKFSYNQYLALKNRIVALTGKWNLKEKDLRVHANMDTLKIGFLSPFLSSFSDIVSGDASGVLDFIMTPDSLYFDGKVKIKNAQLGIAPLNMVYNIVDQEILFDHKGILFNQVSIQDKFKNKAVLSGYVFHNKFNDFIIDLNISTDRIMALNTPKQMDASFFGDGFVSGDISIHGDTQQLNFSSQNIKTLPGSAITFPITSASSVSAAKGIYFITGNTNKRNARDEMNKSSTIMNFDFVFDITRDADVKIELDPIDGILKCKTLGRLHLLYNTNTDDMDLNGNLSIVSGKFNMSLKNFFPKEFTIVEGGTISFSGPLTSAQLNVNALYQKTVSLAPLSQNLKRIGRTDVAAYLGLRGNLMNPTPNFTFNFPKLNNDDQMEVFEALDTANQQNGIRQFFSFVFLNTFITSESNPNAPGVGIDMATGMLNSFISGQLNNVNIGVNYVNDQDESSNYREYSVNAAVNLYNDRIWLRTNLGYGHGSSNSSDASSGSSAFVGGVGFDVDINENWKFNFFYFNDQSNNDPDATGLKPQQGGGISLKYRQDFNNRKDFVESWKIKKREKKSKKEASSNP